MAAATDQNYRRQKTLDIVFALSCILMLVSIIWMYAQDQYRDWKVEQREFRNVEEGLLQRSVVRAAPDGSKLGEIAKAEDEVVKARQNVEEARAKAQPKINEWLPKKVKSEDRFQAIKADLDSVVSFYDIAVEQRNAETVGSARWETLNLNVDQLRNEISDLRAKLATAQAEIDANKAGLDAAVKPLRAAEEELAKKEDKLKDLVGEFDRFHKLAEQKRWGAGDWFRNLPVIDAFAPPLKIQQYTLNDLPINYNFKYVTRYDRCTTCHMGIDRATFDRDSIKELTQEPSPALQQKLKDAQESLRKRQEITKSTQGLNPNDIKLNKLELTAAQVKEFSAHPRLDLFVDGNSAHPSEAFGCTICHGGQGSATDFFNASHTPNDAVQQAMWKQPPTKANEHGGHDWHSNHFWDYPMLPSRFLESSCVKCHYQMTDLIRYGSKNEAPKLLRGYNLVRENGCFGCHEIAGIKGGRAVGPDLRLEPTPPLDAYTPAEKAEMLKDALNPPGTLRKVGPSLRRLGEKTNPEWTRLWIKSPRGFRPDTKMPHFYRLSNNLPQVLPGDQADFPDAEIHSIVHYLMNESRAYLAGSDKFRQANAAQLKELEGKQERSDKENREIEELKRKLELFAKPTPLFSGGKLHLVDGDGKVYTSLPEAAKEKANEEQLKRGRKLFSEKGCLACHQHDSTAQAGSGLPAIPSEAHFGPNLSRIAAKLGTGKPGTPEHAESARRWLIQWILNPMISHPRTVMPYTHLSLDEAADVAAWLLNQDPHWPDAQAKQLNTKLLSPETNAERQQLTSALERLATVYLERSYSRGEIKGILKSGISAEALKGKRLDADEQELAGPFANDDVRQDKLMRFIGKKAVAQLGCFGCHDIPGFEYAKPIGTPLNDWGKKDPERLAFEDVSASVREKHYLVPRLTDKDGKPYPVNKDGKKPYDKYFYELLDHHQREGFLYQKLGEPRSYDYDRMRAWDDRLRMPQFRFSRKTPPETASAEEKAKADVEEAEAREAVMTFILGLVAEPIPPRYVYAPTPERAAEIKGRQVLDKFNCAGCHLVRSGVYEFKNTPLVRTMLQDKQRFVENLDKAAGDFKFPDHSAWVGINPVNGPALSMHGLGKLVDVDDDTREQYKLPANLKNLVEVKLTQAVRVPFKEGGKEEIKDIPAGYKSVLVLSPRDLIYPPAGQINAPDIGPYGGAFADLLVRYLVRLDKTKFTPDGGTVDESKEARPYVPPLLLREGEKTQPDWLFRFLRDPQRIRPLAVLRMPKFNMSDDDAAALVNYFAAADRLSNPAFGVQFPYFTIKERDESYLLENNATYVERLQKADNGAWLKKRIDLLMPEWEKQAKQEVSTLEERLKAAEATLSKAKTNDEKMLAVKARDAIARDLKTINEDVANKSFATYKRQWEHSQAYPIDAFRLVAGDGASVCLTCHKVGRIEPKEWQGPDLSQAWQRLRPQWTERWIANPDRFLTYQSKMPMNFKTNLSAKEQQTYDAYFLGKPLQDVTAARDFLMMYPRIVDLPAVRAWPLPVYEATGDKK
jgi:mono/diheme cytochrome c family protein/cbb3-type cytochrome oxidase cytochrome c subunit